MSFKTMMRSAADSVERVLENSADKSRRKKVNVASKDRGHDNRLEGNARDRVAEFTADVAVRGESAVLADYAREAERDTQGKMEKDPVTGRPLGRRRFLDPTCDDALKFEAAFLGMLPKELVSQCLKEAKDKSHFSSLPIPTKADRFFEVGEQDLYQAKFGKHPKYKDNPPAAKMIGSVAMLAKQMEVVRSAFFADPRITSATSIEAAVASNHDLQAMVGQMMRLRESVQRRERSYELKLQSEQEWDKVKEKFYGASAGAVTKSAGVLKGLWGDIKEFGGHLAGGVGSMARGNIASTLGHGIAMWKPMIAAPLRIGAAGIRLSWKTLRTIPSAMSFARTQTVRALNGMKPTL